MASRRFAKLTISLGTISCLVLLVQFEIIHVFNLQSTRENEITPDTRFEVFVDALKAYAKEVSWSNSEKMQFIILAMTDNSFTDMALNLYISSFKRFNITNFLFVGGGLNACEKLRRHKVQCFDFWNDPDSNQSHNYGSKVFIRKMNIRTEMILQALNSNYSVLHTDLDVVFLQDPMPELESILEKHDMAILWDHSCYNAGFLAIKATLRSIEVYTHLQMLTNNSELLDDQKALNTALFHIREKGIATKVLSKSRYLSGKDYYEVVDRNFPNKDFSGNCPDCVVVHNNWIVSKEAKIHRFKETNMWFLDDDRYYSDENRKYLLYYNPVIKKTGNDFKYTELFALKQAFKLADMLNRTLILPRFHCSKNRECPLNNWLKMKTFHETFAPNYRESSFLLSDLVPNSISMKPSKKCLIKDESRMKSEKQFPTCNKQDPGPNLKCIPFNPLPILILTEENESKKDEILKNFPKSQIANVRSTNGTLMESKLKDLFENCQDQVLVLTSLLLLTISFDDPENERLFLQKFVEGFQDSNYLQL